MSKVKNCLTCKHVVYRDGHVQCEKGHDDKLKKIMSKCIKLSLGIIDESEDLDCCELPNGELEFQEMFKRDVAALTRMSLRDSGQSN